MPIIRFEPSGVEVTANVGDALIDVTDQHPEAKVPYSCRAANCGTCRVTVEQGREAFGEPDDEELNTLDVFGEADTQRLCCQLKIKHEVKRIVLRVVEP
jgi:ferredoxin